MSLPGLGPVRRFEEIDSTNRYLADEARLGAPHGLVAVAAYQTAGRGRLGRRWDAPPGANLLVSVLLRPGSDPAGMHACTLAVALAAADSCRDRAGIDPGLKWPNDLVASEPTEPSDRGESGGSQDLKLAGVLAEAITGAQGGPAVVVGLGLNVNWPPRSPAETPATPTPGDPPQQVAYRATSLARLSAVPVDPEILLAGLLEHLDRRMAALLSPDGPAGGPALLRPAVSKLQSQARRALIEEYRGRCVTLGRPVAVEEPTGSFTGTAIDLTGEGQLVVETSSGRRVVTAGDVVHLWHRRAVRRSAESQGPTTGP